jgi:hypothetical protein
MLSFFAGLAIPRPASVDRTMTETFMVLGEKCDLRESNDLEGCCECNAFLVENLCD